MLTRGLNLFEQAPIKGYVSNDHSNKITNEQRGPCDAKNLLPSFFFFFPIMVARFVSRSYKCHDIHCTLETSMLLLKAQPWQIPWKTSLLLIKRRPWNRGIFFYFLAESNPSNSISWMVNVKEGLWKLRFELSEIQWS